MSRKNVLFGLVLAGLALIAGTTADIHTFNRQVTFKSTTLHRDADGGLMGIKSHCETEAADSGGSTQVIDGVIPAKTVCLNVTCRVDTILAGAGLTTWSLGDGVDADLYGTTLALAAGTTVGTTNYTASPMTQAWSASAGDLTMTAAAGVFTTGAVTCCCHYVDATAPTA